MEELVPSLQAVLDLDEQVGVDTCDMVDRRKDRAYVAYRVDMGRSWSNPTCLPSDTLGPVERVDSQTPRPERLPGTPPYLLLTFLHPCLHLYSDPVPSHLFLLLTFPLCLLLSCSRQKTF